jgi:hypothetical protein
MNRRVFLVAGAAVAIARPASAVPFQLPQVEYAADRYIEQADRFQNMRVHYAPGMERLELQGRAAGGNVVLLRHDLGKAWLVMPRMAALAELPGEVLARLGQVIQGTDLKPLGTETVNGVTAVKHQATGTFTGLVWLSRSGIPIKLDGQRRSDSGPRRLLLEQRNVAPGPQAASLFEPPAGLARIQMTDPAWLGFLSDIIG